MLTSSASESNGTSQQPLYRPEMVARDRGAAVQSNLTSPTSPLYKSESRFSAFTSVPSDGRTVAPSRHSAINIDSFMSTTLKPGRSPNWSDAETRFLIALWGEQHQNISQQRNAKAWDGVARFLNQKLAQCGFETFRTGQQCKGRMKSIIFDYKTAKKRMSESGDDDRSCDYFEELDEVLGKTHEGSSSEIIDPSTTTHESEKALSTSGDNEDSNANDEIIVVVNIPTSTAVNVDTTTGLTGAAGVGANQAVHEERELPHRKEPPRKRKKKASADAEDDTSTLRFLKSYMEESDRRDREFLLQMTQMDREREERNYERTMKMMMEMAKVFKSSIACTHENPRGSGVGVAAPTHTGDVRFASGVNMNDNSTATSRVAENHGAPQNRDSRQRANDGGSAQDKKGQPLQFLKEYMAESDRKDREFLLQMSRMDREREERSCEQTMRLMMEVAKVFRGGS